MRTLAQVAVLLALLLTPARWASALGVTANGTQPDEPKERGAPFAVERAGVDEHLGQMIDKTLLFTREDGERVKLSDAFYDGKPVLLILAYYRCPMLCGLVLRGVVEGLKRLDFELGRDYRALTISIDPRDSPDAALHKQASTLSALHAPEKTAAWPFLIGEESASRALADSLGFRFAYDPVTDQYAHPAVIFTLTPDGRISRYLYGIDFSARDLRLSLVEAGQGKTGSVVDRVLLTCYRYDPSSRRYGPYIFGFMRIGGLLILAVVVAMLGLLFHSERRRRRREWREREGGALR